MTSATVIRGWIREACEDNGCPELAERITYVFTGRMTSTHGLAVVNHQTNWHQVRISTPLWARVDEAENCEMVKHEACHIIAETLDSTFRPRTQVQAHGEPWVRAMRNAGLEPEVHHNIYREDLQRRQTRYRVKCPCREGTVSATKRNRIRKGYTYVCRSCNQPVRLT